MRMVESLKPEVLTQLVSLRSQLTRRVVIQLHSPVDVAPVSDLHDGDGRLRVFNRIENTIVPLANTVFVLARQLFASVRPSTFEEKEWTAKH